MANFFLAHLWLLFEKGGVTTNMISYDPLWITLKEKQVTQYKLITEHHVSAGQLSRLRSNRYVSTHTIDILCKILECQVQDIVQYIDSL